MGENVHAGVGASDASEAEEAAEEAVDSAIEDFKEDGGEVPGLGMVFTHGSNFGGEKKNFENFAEKVEDRLGGGKETDWLGGTSAGEILQGNLKEKSTVVILLSSEYLDFGIGIYDGVRSHPRKGGKEGISSALDDLGTDEYLNPYLKYLASKQKDSAESFNTYEYFVMAISPGLKLNEPGKEDEVVEGIFDVTGRRVPIVGGTTVHPGLRENYQFYNGELYEDALIVVAGSSGLKIGFSFAHGYQSTEHRGICTSSQDYVIEEIDGEDAINRYADMMDTTADDLWDTQSKVLDKSSGVVSRLSDIFASVDMDPTNVPFLSRVFANPLGVTGPKGEYALKTPIRVEDGGLVVNQQVPENVAISMMEVDEESILEAESTAIENAVEDSGGDPDIVFLFDCALRKFYLGGDKLEDVIADMQEKFPDSKIIGFNTGGEYGFRKDSEPVSTCLSSSVGIISDELITE